MSLKSHSESILHRPAFSETVAMRILQDEFGKSGTLCSLPSERDQNFQVVEDNGSQWVLKIANQGASEEQLRCQNGAMQHVARRCGTRSCPAPHPSERRRDLLVQVGHDGTAWSSDVGPGNEEAGYLVRLVPYLPGIPLAKAFPHSDELLEVVGGRVGEVCQALVDFRDENARRSFRWDLDQGVDVVRDNWDSLNYEQQALLEPILIQHRREAADFVPKLRRSVIHGDANDYNIIVDVDDEGTCGNVALIDFGDLVESTTINELAICLAYVLLDRDDPIRAAIPVVRGFHRKFPLTETEVAVLPSLIQLRLAVSVSLSTVQSRQVSGDDYLTVSQQPAWRTIKRLQEISSSLFHCRLREACDWEPVPQSTAVRNWLMSHQEELVGVVDDAFQVDDVVPIDLSVHSEQFETEVLLGERIADASRIVERAINEAGGLLGIGGYGEPRLCYQGEQFKTGEHEGSRRSIHLGVDVFAPAGTKLYVPLQGRVVGCHDNNRAYDYGPTIILRHEPEDGLVFYTLYGHLSRESLKVIQVGDVLQAGTAFASMGHEGENGGWPPHLHLQLICDMFGRTTDFLGVAEVESQLTWLSNSPDPLPFLGTLRDAISSSKCSENTLQDLKPRSVPEDLRERRQSTLPPSLSLSYAKPLHIVRGYRQYLFASDSRTYLDTVNNVCHVGHCHPRVVAAATRQMKRLNTNTRYLHEEIVEYAEQLLATFPEPLSVCYFVNSGSEANDLAVRLAQTYTGRRSAAVVDGAYHGNLTSLIDLSPYKHSGPGGGGCPDHVLTLETPDAYRGRHRGSRDKVGPAYASDALQRMSEWSRAHDGIGLLIVESILSCAGQIDLPEDYLARLYEYVREQDGICIADEVQVGFGRVGSHFWGFQRHHVVPDVVTLGKPIGNGHPIGAVVTTRKIADAFANGMEYFNTFGGNPVSAAIGREVLQVICEEGLQDHAKEVGITLRDGLNSLQEKHAIIGDLRGVGLFQGIELVGDPEQRTPAPHIARYVAESMKELGILMSTDGPDHNVLKIKPPMPFGHDDAERLIRCLDRVLSANVMRVVMR